MTSQYYSIGNSGGSTPIVVQGQPYGDNTNRSKQQRHQQASVVPIKSPFAKSSHDRPHKQQSGYRDVVWAVLFYAQLIAMFVTAYIYIPIMQQTIANSFKDESNSNTYEPYEEDVNDDNNNNNRSYRRLVRTMMTMIHGRQQQRQLQDANDGNDEDYTDDAALLIYLTPYFGIAVIGTIALLAMALSLMMHHAAALIRFSLIMNIILLVGGAIVSLLSGMIEIVISNTVLAVILLYFVCSIWNRIPFAAANLSTATTAVYANMGLIFYAITSVILGFIWFIVWFTTFIAVSLTNQECDENNVCTNTTSSLILFLMLISLYWTTGVITNVVHVTTAGTVGTFWFVPSEANGCCSKAVRDSYIRSITTSFGSICLGSLIVAIINAVRDFVRSSRDNGDSLVICCADCILGCIESLVEYFNKWAYVYVGLYGFSFMEAGSNVMNLFRNRGWTSIVTDVIVDNVLRMLSFTVAFVLAVLFFLALYFSKLTKQVNDGDGENVTLGYILMISLIPFVMVYVMANTMFSVVGSAVNTVIVCYADAPNEFQVNHPQLSERMSHAWRQAYPDQFDQ